MADSSDAPLITAEQVLQILERFPWDEWNARLGPGLAQHYRDIVTRHGAAAATAAGGTWNPSDPFLAKFATGYVGERITQLDATTKAEVALALRSALDGAGGISIQALNTLVLETVREKFTGYEQYRALRIARSESAIASNHGNIFGFAQAGVSEVDVLDGTNDELCAAASGQRWTLRQSLEEPIAHPNCQRGFSPVLPDLDQHARGQMYELLQLDLDASGVAARSARTAERLGSLEDPMGRVLDPADEA